MAVATLQQNHYLPAVFTVPESKTVLIDMEAEHEVNLFVLLNEQELLAFQQNQRPPWRAAFNTKQFYGKINLASLGAPVVPSTTAATALLGSPTPPQLGALPGLAPFFPISPLPGSTWYLVIENRQGNPNTAIFYRVYNA